MKHQYEDYIKWIVKQVVEVSYTADSPVNNDFLHYQSDIDFAKSHRASLLANKATLERHRPKEHCKNPNCAGPICLGCGSKETVQIAFPCPSFLDVTNQLDEVMR